MAESTTRPAPALPARVTRGVRLWWTLLGASVRSRMQYRFDIMLSLLLGAVYQGSGFAFIWVVLERFELVGGWEFGQVAFLYGLRLCAHGVAGVGLGNLMVLGWLVRHGDFDRVLLRPTNALVQVISMEFRVAQFGDFITGVAIFAVATTLVDIAWTPFLVLFCVAAVIGGALVEGAVLLVIYSLTFRLFDANPIAFFVDDLFGRLGSYPLHVFGVGAQWALTFVVPVAFMAYLPASALLGMADHAPAGLGWAAPLVGVVLFTASYVFWTRQIRRYQSSGH